jgi:hypothetical protein
MPHAFAVLHHLTWVVADLDAALARFGAAEPDVAIREALPERGVVTARLRSGRTWLVFVQPVGPGVPADRLATAGEGPLLASFRVPSLDAALAELAAHGIGALGPVRTGVGGWRVVDVELQLPGGVTVQLCEDDADAATVQDHGPT